MSMACAAGTRPRPGIRMMLPVIGIKKPAPADPDLANGDAKSRWTTQMGGIIA